MLKKFFDVNFFFSTVLVPMVGLALYCGSFAFFSSRFQLEGINFDFATKFGKLVLIILSGVSLTFFVLLKIRPGDRLVFRNSNKTIYPADICLLLLPITPIVQYLLNNRELLSPTDTLYVLIVFVLFSGFYIFALPVLLGRFLPARTLMILGLAFVFTIVSMASISHYFAWFEKGALRKQLPVFIIVFLVIWLLDNFNKRKIVYLLILLNFIANTSTQLIMPREMNVAAASIEQNKLLSVIGDRRPVRLPNIYLLVYDAYVPNETMLGYGIDNSAQEKFLHGLNFKLYPEIYSIGGSTLGTMSRVLNASTEFYGSTRRAVSGDGVVQKILSSLGYKTYGLFPYDFMFRGIGEHYDYSIPEIVSPPYIQLLKAIFLGEFRFDIEDAGFGKQDRDQFVESKHSIFKEVSGNQVFVYMHTNRPSHSQISGTCRAVETEKFEMRLAQANIEMKQDVNLIVENDPSAIVIIAGDHGPYLTKNCSATTGVYDTSEISRLDIQDRHGVFLAIRWPSGDFGKYDDITVLQDLFPAVFAYLYQDPSILQSKVEPVIPVENSFISGVSVDNGIIHGGMDDGEPLFLSGDD